jgi:hypothetical protein
MPKCGIEVVAPQQTHHAAAEPDAFGMPGRTNDQPCRFRKLVDLLLRILGGIGRLALGRLFGGLCVAALSECRSKGERQGRSEHRGC